MKRKIMFSWMVTGLLAVSLATPAMAGRGGGYGGPGNGSGSMQGQGIRDRMQIRDPGSHVEGTSQQDRDRQQIRAPDLQRDRMQDQTGDRLQDQQQIRERLNNANQ